MGGEKFDTPHPEGYLFGENMDLNFLGNRPVQVEKDTFKALNTRRHIFLASVTWESRLSLLPSACSFRTWPRHHTSPWRRWEASST